MNCNDCGTFIDAQPEDIGGYILCMNCMVEREKDAQVNSIVGIKSDLEAQGCCVTDVVDRGAGLYEAQYSHKDGRNRFISFRLKGFGVPSISKQVLQQVGHKILNEQ
jgi:hypothetical protein